MNAPSNTLKFCLAPFVSSELPGLLIWEGMSRLPGLLGCAICPLSFSVEESFNLLSVQLHQK